MKKLCLAAVIAGTLITIGPAGLVAAGNNGVTNFGQCHQFAGADPRSLAPGQSDSNAGPITVNSNGFNRPAPFEGGNTCSV